MQYTEKKRARILRFAEQTSIPAAAKKYNVAEGTIYQWRTNGVLPVTKAEAPTKPRALRATQFACPHCGGPVVMPK